ncbi:hydroxyacylglutathione hydrolase [Rhodobium orientis]|uniref:Hydroxyacylglutathione hydrolase n=1 Tax=Rhodobium orientis TaxID=34017 RepID=A0A327JPT4_9HYPH|nr:hydroxyacylglutathione hydrolase [Rhodobium orientis]MBB4303676.1 hydroxyacylglutathione hydrolase [Rhodobium orientis]MBK5951869.1 hydroxyacylglutathione hydrolase [Rhodobium orientis]RAI28470.1 hydroxyacylglutathione hydrolase [Rhodobium orientis]
MSAIEVHQFACLSDNYAVLVHNPATAATLLIDAPEEGPVRAALAETGWTLTHILVTHHHWDHTQGIAALKAETGCAVIGPAAEEAKIKTLDETVGDGDVIHPGGIEVRAVATPGHTLGQISYYLPEPGVAFTGDTLFSLGCGRVFEGDATMMWGSMQRLMQRIPDEAKIYCGHEYTLANAKFAITVDPDNAALKERLSEVEDLRKRGVPTLPTTMAREKATNPFLRAKDPAIRSHLKMASAEDAAVFGEIRSRKDNA